MSCALQKEWRTPFWVSSLLSKKKCLALYAALYHGSLKSFEWEVQRDLLYCSCVLSWLLTNPEKKFLKIRLKMTYLSSFLHFMAHLRTEEIMFTSDRILRQQFIFYLLYVLSSELLALNICQNGWYSHENTCMDFKIVWFDFHLPSYRVDILGDWVLGLCTVSWNVQLSIINQDTIKHHVLSFYAYFL